jgi:DNA-binding transcriptional ArsR family regulator
MARKKSERKPALSGVALEMVAQRFRALADPTRLRILQTLFDGELNVRQIGDCVGTSQANVSRHLAGLMEQGLLSRRREGLYSYYSIADPSIYALCELVCSSLAARFERARDELTTS